jgi:cytochrome c peroxidase
MKIDGRSKEPHLWVLAMALACQTATPLEAPLRARAETKAISSSEPIEPIPLDGEIDQPVSALGERLFSSTLTSADGRVACSSCHAPDHALAERSAVSENPFRPKTSTNSTSLFNVRYFYKIKWNGEFESIEAHLDALIKTPKIMGSTWTEIAARLGGEAEWVSQFRQVFPDGLTENNVKRALLEYERSLVTPNAPFDRFLRGEADALSPEGRHGYELFKDYGCISCHQGMAVGANMLERVGVMRDYFQVFGRSSAPERDADLGRFSVTHREEDRHVFRVPSLRNVAATGPYFHNGLVPTLDEAVRLMGEYQLDRELSEPDIHDIVAFLQSLSGEYRGVRL